MKQTIVSKKFVNEERMILRECHGRRLAISLRVFAQTESDRRRFFVQSEMILGKYYYVKIVFESSETGNFWCSCPDYTSNRTNKCKHIFAVQYAIRLGLVQTVDKKLPISQVNRNTTTISDL